MGKFLIFAVIISTFISCIKNPSENDTLHKVSGILYYSGEVIEQAKISIDNKINYTTHSDENGYFEILDVREGSHTLYTEKSFDNGSYIEKSFDLDVYNDVYLNSLQLPKPVNLYLPDSITNTSVKITWSKTDADDFREYKLYRHPTSGLDETTGLLVHVSTSIEDTSFTNNDLIPLTDYYYRVYVMNEFGKLGGSNIVHCQTLNSNAISNGGFEEFDQTTLFPDSYYSFISAGSNPFKSNSLNPINGNYCLLIDIRSENNFDNMLMQEINSNILSPGEAYRLNYWFKCDSLLSGQSVRISLINGNINNGSMILNERIVYGPHAQIGWTKYSFDFTMPAIFPEGHIELLINCMGFGTEFKSYFDDIEILKIE